MNNAIVVLAANYTMAKVACAAAGVDPEAVHFPTNSYSAEQVPQGARVIQHSSFTQAKFAEQVLATLTRTGVLV